MNELFPEIEPFATEMLPVSDIHTLYIERCGNPEGKPVIFLHGGPGAGLSTYHRRFFNPKKYHIILFDQRGAGRSTPFASLEDNTTWHCVADIEKIRKHFGIEKWMVFGGSWGSTLSLAYAQSHPSAVSELVLRGIFLCRHEDIQWFYQSGASYLFPDFWQDYCAPIPLAERGDMVKAFYQRLCSENIAEQKAAAWAWSMWEARTLHIFDHQSAAEEFLADPKTAISLARIECHYFINNLFLPERRELLDQVDKIQDIPTVIIHGRYDVVCPIKQAFDLKEKLPKAKLIICEKSGHAASEPEIADQLILTTNRFL